MNNPSIYVGTYAKYNNGSIFGEWINLSQFNSIDEFYEYCRQLHNDEVDPEFVFQDYEFIPDGYVDESYLNPAIFDVLDELDDSEYESFCTYVSYFGTGSTVEAFRDSYIGRYNSEEDFAHEMVEQTISNDVPEFFLRYFDYEAYARDLFSDGYSFVDGIVYCSY